MILTSRVELDEFTKKACEPFDFRFEGETSFEVPDFDCPNIFMLGLIVGPSGTGKSSLLKHKFNPPPVLFWEKNKSIISQISSTPEGAVQRLSAVGLNSVPSWCKPRHVLSTGEGFRADLAKVLSNNCCVDEFTSTVDRNVAKAASVGIRRLVEKENLFNVVLASCHYDIIEWLQPDWVFDTSTKEVSLRGSLRPRPKIKIDLEPCSKEAWSIFSKHHYLSSNLNKSSRCWLAWWDNNLVGFVSVLSFPHGSIKKAFREHRTVVLPDYQGLGIGVRISDEIARHYVEDLGCRYFSRTAHPRMGEYRDRHPNWKPTSTNHGRSRENGGGLSKSKKQGKNWKLDLIRNCYSHEWVKL